MKAKVQEITAKIRNMIMQYPMVLLASLVTAVTIVMLIERVWSPQENFTPFRLVLTSGLGISMLFGVKMLSQRIAREVVLHAIAILVLIGYFFVLPSAEDDFDDTYVFVIFPAVVLSHLFVAFAPYLSRNPETKFWEYNKNLFINTFLTGVFTGVLTGGVMLAILAVQSLFGLDFREEIYGETFVFLAIFGSTCIFLLFNDGGLENLEKDGVYPVVLKFFTQFILIPLLMIYVVILYFYSGKIILNWELPEGWVSYLVLIYSVIGILALLLVHPLKESLAKSWVRMFGRIFYVSLLPLIVLLFVAIFTRLLEYGFTEARYYVLLLAIWLTAVACYFVFFRKATIKFIPVSLFALGLFSLLFPFLNTFSVAIRSQKNQLEKLLVDENLLKDGKIDFDKTVSSDVVENINNKFEFLSERSETAYLKNFIAVSDTSTFKNFAEDKSIYIGHLFTNVIDKPDASRNRWTYIQTDTKPIELAGFDYVIPASDVNADGWQIGNDRFTVDREHYSQSLKFAIKLNGSDNVDLSGDIKKLVAPYEKREGDVKADSLFVERELGSYRIRVVFKEINISHLGNENANYSLHDMVVLVADDKKK